MNQEYEKVPNIITGKDLDYLSDMFNWNYVSFKKSNDSLNNIQDVEIHDVVQKACNTFNNNLNKVLNILQEGQNGQ